MCKLRGCIFSLFWLFTLLLYGQVAVANDCNTVTDGLVACYHFEGNAQDGSGNGNDGTVNGATLTTDRFGNLNGAYSFDGINDYLSLPNKVSGDFSVVFWVKTAKSAPAGTNWFEGWGLIDAEVCGVTNDWGLALIDGGKISFGIVNYNTTIKSTSLVNDSDWHLIVGTRNQNSGVFQLYVDGALQATGEGSKNLLQAAPWIGVGNNPCDVSANRRWFDGVIDDVRIYNRTLSDEEIQQLSPVNDTSITQSTYLGCFRDNDKADLWGTNGRDLSGLILVDDNMTTELCIASCQGFTYAATQYSKACFCGNSYGKYGTASNCDMPCPGNSGQICGGGWANSVYVVKTSPALKFPEPTVFPCPCPSLGPARATDTNGKSVITSTKHEAGISVNNQPPVIQVIQNLSDTVNVAGDIIVDPVDVGQPVDIFVYAAATFPGLSAVSYYMLGPGLTILPWNQQPASLVAFSNGTLGVVQTVQMYSGTFFYPGTLKVYFGYRLPNGIVVTSNTPIDISIEP